MVFGASVMVKEGSGVLWRGLGLCERGKIVFHVAMKVICLTVACVGVLLSSSCSCNCNKINKDLLEDYKPMSSQQFQ